MDRVDTARVLGVPVAPAVPGKGVKPQSVATLLLILAPVAVAVATPGQDPLTSRAALAALVL